MSKKILFIDDETEIVELMKIRLEFHGYEVISAVDGEEGLEMAQKEKPDLILLDKIMPKMDGLEVCQRLKADPKTKDIPVIIVSASGGKDLPERCLAAGVNDVIIKPFEAEDVLAKIKALLKKG